MTNYEHMISMSKEELLKWICELVYESEAPWEAAIAKKCKACQAITDAEVNNDEGKAPCEESFRCRLFPELDEFPADIYWARMWADEPYIPPKENANANE